MSILTVYRNTFGDLVGVDDDGFSFDKGDWSRDDTKRAEVAARQAGVKLGDLPNGVLLKLADIESQDYDGNLPGDNDDPGSEDGQSGDQSDQGDDGDADGEADDADGDDGDQGDSQGEQESDQEGEQGLDYDESEGEGDSFDNPIADELWELYRPRVVQIAESRADQAWIHSNRKIKQSGGSGGGGITVRVSGRKTGKVDGVTHFMFDKVLRAVARGLNIYLPGPPGTGKSHMAMQVAEALGRPIHIDSFSPMSTESKLNGFVDANGNVVETGYRRSFIGGWIYVGDELDNANPAIVTGLNSGLANGRHAFPDGTFEMHPDFQMIATANTLGTGPTAEFAGRQKLDPATLNRFVKIPIGTDEVMETALVESLLSDREAERWLSQVRRIRRAVEGLGIRHFVTMRDSLNGARLMAPGDGSFTLDEALHMTILNVLSEDQQEKIREYRG